MWTRQDEDAAIEADHAAGRHANEPSAVCAGCLWDKDAEEERGEEGHRNGMHAGLYLESCSECTSL